MCRIRGIFRLGTALLAFPGFLGALAPWMPSFTNTQWHWYRIISNVNPILLNGDTALNDFPLLVRLTNDAGLKTVHSNAGDDITFAGADGTQLYHEIEYFNKANGDLVAWVCLPSFTNRTLFYLFYSNNDPNGYSFNGGNTADGAVSLAGLSSLRTTAGAIEPTIRRRVWDTNYWVVLHFNETNGQGPPRDSSRNTNDAVTNEWQASRTVTNTNTGWILPANAGGGIFNYPQSNAATSRMGIFIPFTNIYNRGWTNLALTNLNFTALALHEMLTSPSGADWPAANFSSNYAYLFSFGKYGLQQGFEIAFQGTNQGIAAPLFAGINNSLIPTLTVTFTSNQRNVWTLRGGAVGGYKNGGLVNMQRNETVFVNSNLVSFSSANAVGTLVNDLYGLSIGGASFSTGVTYGKAASYPLPGLYEEFQLSIGTRSDSWMATQFANLTTNNPGMNFAVSPALMGAFGYLSNTFFPGPVTNIPFILALDPGQLAIMNFGPNYLTNITWYLSNTGTGAVTTFSQPCFFGQVESNYTTSVQAASPGVYQAWARLADANANTSLTPARSLIVQTQANLYDLSHLTLRATNAGVLLDLDSPTNIPPYALSVIRGDKVAPVTRLASPRTVFLDAGDFYYNVPYPYLITVDYGDNRIFVTAAQIAASEPARQDNLVSTTSGDPADRTVQNWNFRLTLPANRTDLNGTWSVEVPTLPALSAGTPLGAALKEYVVTNRSSTTAVNDTVRLVAGLPIQNGLIQIPGTGIESWYALSEKDRYALAEWGNGRWNVLPTTRTLGTNRFILQATTTNAGRFGIMFGADAGSVSGLPSTKPVARVLLVGGDAYYGLLHFTFENPKGRPVNLSVRRANNGEPVFQTRGLTGLSYDWNGLDSRGSPLLPGLYLWQVQIGTDMPVRGSFLVQWR